ncbi:unnamed protein product, partial [Meganyctiphanes norvegica]
QDAAVAVPVLSEIFPDVSLDELQHWLEAADGDPEAATMLILENQTQQLEINMESKTEPSKKNDNDAMLIKAVDELDIKSVAQLVKSAEDMDPENVDIALELAQEKGNSA